MKNLIKKETRPWVSSDLTTVIAVRSKSFVGQSPKKGCRRQKDLIAF